MIIIINLLTFAADLYIHKFLIYTHAVLKLSENKFFSVCIFNTLNLQAGAYVGGIPKHTPSAPNVIYRFTEKYFSCL